MRTFAATPCRPLLSTRTPFNAKNGPAGGSRPAALPHPPAGLAVGIRRGGRQQVDVKKRARPAATPCRLPPPPTSFRHSLPPALGANAHGRAAGKRRTRRRQPEAGRRRGARALPLPPAGYHLPATSCRRLLPPVPAAGSCRRLLPLPPAARYWRQRARLNAKHGPAGGSRPAGGYNNGVVSRFLGRFPWPAAATPFSQAPELGGAGSVRPPPLPRPATPAAASSR